MLVSWWLDTASLTQPALTNAPRPSIPHNRRVKDGSVIAQGAMVELPVADEEVEVNNAAQTGAERLYHLCKK